MSDVGLSPEQSTRYAHSFSGGQRQRIGIARALASNPEFIVCDEPVSALDVSIQAQILNTFQELQKKLGLTYLFVAHNLLVVKHISDRIAVMYLGHIVELCESEELYKHPLHPYTISLLSAIPEPDPKRARANKRQILEGEIPSPLHVPSGCPFRLRCPRATEQCADTRPELIEAKGVIEQIETNGIGKIQITEDEKDMNNKVTEDMTFEDLSDKYSSFIEVEDKALSI